MLGANGSHYLGALSRLATSGPRLEAVRRDKGASTPPMVVKSDNTQILLEADSNAPIGNVFFLSEECLWTKECLQIA